MPSTRSSRKRQTQLHFEPLPASSPARISQPEATRDRAAAVTLGRQKKISDWNVRGDATMSPPHVEFSPSSPSAPQTRKPGPIVTPAFMSSGVTSKAQRKFNAVSLDDSDAEEFIEALGQTEENDMPSSPPDIENESDSDVVVATPRRRLVRRNPRVEGSEDEHLATPSKKRRLRRKSSPQNKSESSETATSDEGPVHSSRRILNRSSRSAAAKDTDDRDEDHEPRSLNATRRTTMEKEDLAEDLDFLSPTDDDGPRELRASLSTPKKSARTKALEALKKRRSGQGRRDDHFHECQPPPDDADEDEDRGNLPFLVDDVEDEDDQAFIVDDDQEGESAELPIEFSHLRSEKPVKLFKYVIEWMVQKKLNPGFRSSDEIYQVAFDRLNAFAHQMGDSKFQSSAWTSVFLKSLKSRPDMTEIRIDGSWRDKCDACNRSGHPATFEMHFSGRQYNKDTLEPDSDDESEEENEGETFFLGKFCRANAKNAHTFAHWRYHLNTWVVDHLRQENHLEPAKIIQRDGWGTKKREKYANEVVDHMESEGQIKDLYRDFKNSVGDAQDAGSLDFFGSSP